MLGGGRMSDINETVAPLATEAGQDAIVQAINNISSFSYAVRAENAATTATQKASDASNSAADALAYRNAARNWATKMDTYVDTETITIPAEQEGEEDTTETVYLFSARYYAAQAQDFYNNMTFDNAPTQNSTNLLTSGTIYTALADKADKSTTYTKTETDNLINTRLAELVASAPAALDTLQELATALGNDPNFATTIATQLGNKADKSNTYTKTEVDTALSNVQSTLTFDNVPTANSDNPVKSSGIKTALDGKQDTLTFDSTPTANSTNPVTSGGIYTALQNVNIDIDDEITEDSDNPVTSAAIYEALQNFTPSGDSGGAGNASGVVVDVLWEGDVYSFPTDILLNHNWSDYDLICFKSAARDNDTTSKYQMQNIHTKQHLQKLYDDYQSNIDQTLILPDYELNNRNAFIVIKVASNNLFKIVETNHKSLLQITGIKFSKNLSEQMSSNVLYENASGWSSGNITLSDSYKNYDFLCFYYKEASWGATLPYYIDVAHFEIENETSVQGYDTDYMDVSVVSETVLSAGSRNKFLIYKIVGFKMAKGGYSGIVSDARMTVKSGRVTTPSNITNGNTWETNVTFDSPMPDTNYYVLAQTSNDMGGVQYIETRVRDNEKTTNGFKFVVMANGGTVNAGHNVDWIAIRPNSYTREGMVEDVLYTTPTGFTTGTINLSGNISDYDLIEFVIGDSIDGEKYTNNRVYSSSVLTNIMGQQNKFFHLAYYNGGWQMLSVDSDNKLSCSNRSGSTVLYKITGIKFGRYISGVAVDTTVTQNSDAVVTSGAVYNALQNIPSGGGGSGGNIVLDSTPTENSTNGVTSGGVYEALHPSMESRIPNDMKVNTANQVLFVDGGRTQYKKYGGVAVAVVANVYRNLHAVLVSDNADAVRGYSSYNTNDVTIASTLTYAGKQFYYSHIPYAWNKNDYSVTSSNIRIIQNLFDSNEQVARYILDILYPELASKNLEDYNIKDVYTKEEIYNILYKTNKELDFPFLPIPEDMRVINAGTRLFSCGGRNYYKRNNGRAAGALCKCGNNKNLVAILFAETSDAAIQYSSYSSGTDSTVYNRTRNGKTYYFTFSPYGMDNPSSFSNSVIRDLTSTTFEDAGVAADYILDNILLASNYSLSDYSITDAYTKTEVDALLQNAGGSSAGGSSITVDSTITQNSQNPVTSAAIYSAIQDGLPFEFRDIVPQDMLIYDEHATIYTQSSRSYRKEKDGYAAVVVVTNDGDNFVRSYLISDNSDAVDQRCNLDYTNTPTVGTVIVDGKTYYWTKSPLNQGSETSYTTNYRSIQSTGQSSGADAVRWIINNLLYSTAQKTLANYRIGDAYTKSQVDTLLQNVGSPTVDSTITQGGTNPVEGGAIYTALASKGDVTTDTAQNITGTKTFVGSKKVAFKQSAANDKLGFTLFGNTGTERGYLEFNPQNTVDGVTGLMTLGNYATSAAGLTQVGFRRYSNISGASGAYNLLMPMVADAKTPFSLTTTYQNFYLPLGFTDGTTTVKTAKSGVVDLSPLLASLEARIAALEGN